MMLKPSIDVLLDKVDSKYSLVVLEAKRAHELRDGEAATQSFSSVKPTLQALEELAEGNVSIHPAPEAKRPTGTFGAFAPATCHCAQGWRLHAGRRLVAAAVLPAP